MKNPRRPTMRKTSILHASLAAALLLGWAAPSTAATWTALSNSPPDFPGTMLQLTDGTVIVQNNGSNFAAWMRLTPNSAGSYVNGTWSSLAPMSIQRLYFASHVLRNGDVWVLGGEYSGSALAQNITATGERYHYSSNTWSAITPHPEGVIADQVLLL